MSWIIFYIEGGLSEFTYVSDMKYIILRDKFFSERRGTAIYVSLELL